MYEKIFVLDTNIICIDGEAYNAFEDNIVVAPSVIRGEADKLKKRSDESGYNARLYLRKTEKLTRKYDLVKNPAPTKGDGLFYESYTYNINGKEPLHYIADIGEHDLDIIRCAKVLMDANPDKYVEIVANDRNLLAVARQNGLVANEWKRDEVKLESIPSMQEEVVNSELLNYINLEMYHQERRTVLTEKLLADFGVEISDYPHNKYVIVKGSKNDEPRAKQIFCYDINENALMPISLDLTMPIGGIRPKNIEQIILMDAIMNKNNWVVAAHGPPGTGKTLCMLACALEMTYRKKKVDKDDEAVIYLTKPAINVGGEEYGFLPGDITAKVAMNYKGISKNLRKIMAWWRRTEFDSQGNITIKNDEYMRDDIGKNLDELESHGYVEVYPLGHLRGDTIMPNEILLVDEAQNTLPSVMKAITTRIEDGSKLLISGDPHQVDNPLARPEYNGLSSILNEISKRSDPKYRFNAAVHLTKSERGIVSEFYYNKFNS